MTRLASLIATLLVSFAALAAEPPVFSNENEELRFRELAAELRCVMCQNQSLADSNAPIAQDLRNEVLVLMREGKSDAEIKDHLVERYSEFVLYKPRWSARNALLWLTPLLVLIIGAIVIMRIVRQQKNNTSAPQSDIEQEW
jgi:cytochrome c-type biogenesis protein CcmH